MTAYDVRRFWIEPEVFEDAIEDCLFVKKRIEGVLHLFARSFIGHQIDLERGHLALRERAATPAPSHMYQSRSAPRLRSSGSAAVERDRARTGSHFVDRARGPCSFVPNTSTSFELNRLAFKRHAGMEEQVAVVDSVKAARFQA